MSFVAAFAGPQCTIRASVSSDNAPKRVNKRNVVSRAQKQPKSEETSSQASEPSPLLSLENGAAVLEETKTKAPSPAINVISPVSQ
jgi:hypothetical protein